jgi:hypothetical protein
MEACCQLAEVFEGSDRGRSVEHYLKMPFLMRQCVRFPMNRSKLKQ